MLYPPGLRVGTLGHRPCPSGRRAWFRDGNLGLTCWCVGHRTVSWTGDVYSIRRSEFEAQYGRGSFLNTCLREANMDRSLIVAVASSAGDLEAISELLSAMPAVCPEAFVIVQHLDPGRRDVPL